MKTFTTFLLTLILSLSTASAGTPDIQRKTVKEFLRMSDKDTTICELIGVVTRVRNYEKGNLFLDDGTGSVLIYGIYDARYKRRFPQTDVREGDTLRVWGKRYVYDHRVIEMKNALYAGHKEGPDHKNVAKVDKLDENPTFKGKSPNEFPQWVSAHLKYPAEARNDYADGVVVVRFVVGRNGMVLEPEIVEGLHPALDKEVLRVLSESPKWKPGKVDGHPVRVSYTMPVKFSIDM